MTALPVRSSTDLGDEGKYVVNASIGKVDIHAYESLIEPGRVVVDIDSMLDGIVVVTVNDVYVHGGPVSRPRYNWTGWEAETDLGNDDDREDVFTLTITDEDEEYAVIVHRTVDGKYPLDGPLAKAKEARAKAIVDALNAK